MIDKLLRLQVTLSGLTKPLYQMFPTFTWRDALNVLEISSMNMQSLSLVTIIKVGHELPQQRPLYVPRFLSNRRKLDPKLFRLDCKDVFVFKGVSKNLLHQLIEQNVLRSSKGQRSYVSCRHIYLEDDEDWDYIEQICSDPLHLVCKDGEDYVLMRATKITDAILTYSVGPHYSEEAYVSEDSFLIHLLSDKNSRGALICDLPGMGKTWLLEKLVTKLRQQTTRNIVVLYVSLQHFSMFLENQRLEQTQQIPSEVFFGHICSTNLGVCLLKQIIAKKDINFALVLDGFDELSEIHSNEFISFLVSLSQSKHCNIKIVISSRPHLRACLEKKFNLISFDILPFQTREQIEFIMSVWVQEYPNIDDKTLEAFAKQCLNSIKSIQIDTCDNIVGIPLKCYMFARINRKFVRQLSTASGTTSFRVPDIAIFKSTADLYEEFAKESFQKISMPEDRQRVLNFHTFKALKLIIPHISEVYMLAKDLQSAVSFNDVHKVGILMLSDDQTFFFIHRSFAEYFVGRFFAKFWSNPNAYERRFAIPVVLFFITTALDVELTRSDKSIEWVQVYFDQTDSIGIPEMQTLEFRYRTMLTFMNHNLHNFANVRGAAWRYIKRWILPSKIPRPVYRKEISSSKIFDAMFYRTMLRMRTSLVLLACIDNGFTSIIYLIGQLITSLFPQQEIKSLIQPTTANEKLLAPIVSLLMYKIALSGSIEIGNALFNISSAFEDNYLLRYCQEFPKEFYSPLEIAIAKSDSEMFEFFFSKVELPWKRLMIRCLLGSQMSQSEIVSRVNIFKQVIMKEQMPSIGLNSSEFGVYLASLSPFETTNLRLLKNFGSKHDIGLNYLSQHCKTVLLRDSIIDGSDEGFTELIELLFWEDNKVISQNWTQIDNGKTVASNIDCVPETKPKRGTGKLNFKEASKTFQSLGLEFNQRMFKNIHTVETFKLLCKIAPDFSLCNQAKLNYIHFAATLNKVSWIHFLFSQAHDANQKNLYGRTALHCIDPENALALTMLLIDNGANVYAVDDELNNFAHTLVLTCGDRRMNVPEEWVSYTIDNGYSQLWNMKDKRGRTPFEIFSEQLNPCYCLLRLLAPHVRGKRSTKLELLEVIYEGSDDEYISVLLRHFNKMDRLQPRHNVLKNEIIPAEDYEASRVLQALDIPLTKKAMSNLNYCYCCTWSAFEDMHSIETLKVQVALCPDLSVCNGDKWNYMHLAVYQGKVDWVEFLIKSGQDINQSDFFGNSPLLCMRENSVEITRVLLQNGADVNHLNYRKENAAHRLLMVPIENECNIIHSWVAYTVHNGLEKLWDAEDFEGNVAIEDLSELIDNIGMEPVAIDSKTLLFIFNKDFRLDFSNYSGIENFNLNSLCAIIFGCKQNLQHISRYQKQWLFEGAILAGTEMQIIHLLLLLFPKDNVEMAQAEKLLNTQPNLDNFTAEDILDLLDVANAKNVLQTAQLGDAALENVNALEILKILRAIIPDFRLVNSFGFNYLHCAVYWGRPNWVKYLLIVGYDVNQRTKYGLTPILLLSPINLLEVTRLLIENGCDTLVVDEDDETFVERLSTRCKLMGEHITEEFTEYTIDLMFKIHEALFHPKVKRYVNDWRFP